MDRVEVGRLDPGQWLGRRVRVVIDRPIGSRHPNGSFQYEVNYGYVPGLLAPDGEDLDAYVLGPVEPVAEYLGDVIAVVVRNDDIEDKLVVGKPAEWTAATISRAIAFQEHFFDSRVMTTAS